ncbi:MAG: phosphoribosylformylglycinamidine synthase I [Nitrospirae bacterium CG18_big_fil_WC_8_21_14_2_50_70_55]|nr:phosphoribosylformylglycinamidine synthase subunit PurQ [Deltaproteobacteria bacterium]OIP64724.1 MAG: phosphoribosylformylglycinamidine synthase I [Nitrospirae bacterium CG2_30_70_394]PIQ03861.1 MAG: phosphoribosylformylglycinamidine synthase I [Nitrospirae bacterium CG18_big_fil_WC_8_21_14_2_50_70_55]PIU79866.1 MAG: phosphoribosylformylglycinamidine synthase I [Nitrospirae bacterium CG06_land_8_20_14_3_00_70_43]PIW82529.1 MAG: phosphoribosylformylglycinamidine synthase I [Nitrospirae bacte
MNFGIVVFPGSNCDHDCYHVAKHVVGGEAVYLWHKEERLPDLDCIIVPGGFSYGDYLRAGAIARLSPVMAAVADFAAGGGLVLGICNGFQVLLEAGLLPGAMRRNDGLRFVCQQQTLRVENGATPFTRAYTEGQVVRIPIAHAEGNYYADPETLAELEANRQVVFRYCEPAGEITEPANPNGSLANIAGICNRAGNVLGMMPHPERAAEPLLGSTDGLVLFHSLLGAVTA